MEQMRKLPIGIQTFEEIRKENYLYVDKTAMVYQLANVGKPYFLSRPRRFGKSLLISTFEAYFQGRKDLFEGLAITNLETEWERYPVLHLDLNAKKYETSDDLAAMLNQYLEKWEQKYGNEKRNRSSEERFAYIIEQAYIQTGKQVVVLIDEYDKPLLQAILDEPLLEEYRRTLKAFYGVLKSADRYLRFVFLTGVTKFAQVSVFSDLNQLNDISMDYAYNSLCGITKEELSSNFVPEIKNLGEFLGLTFEEIVDRLEKQYDGYHFCEDTTVGLFNPFSVLNALQKLKLGNYWFQTGTPTYLVDLLKQSDYDLRLLINGIETTNSAFSEYRAEANNPLPMIYQSGYLTIKGYDERFGIYYLGFPNREVEEGFMRFLLPYYTTVTKVESPFEILKFTREVESGDYDSFFRRLQSFFADTPYEMIRDLELHYQNVLFIVFKLVGFYVKVEYHTSEGRVDLVLQTDRFIYVMEFKLNGTAEEALRQINEKQYARPFETDGRKLFKVGVNFSKKSRNIEKWIVG